jgi:hypothetical protein
MSGVHEGCNEALVSVLPDITTACQAFQLHGHLGLPVGSCCRAPCPVNECVPFSSDAVIPLEAIVVVGVNIHVINPFDMFQPFP